MLTILLPRQPSRGRFIRGHRIGLWQERRHCWLSFPLLSWYLSQALGFRVVFGAHSILCYLFMTVNEHSFLPCGSCRDSSSQNGRLIRCNMFDFSYGHLRVIHLNVDTCKGISQNAYDMMYILSAVTSRPFSSVSNIKSENLLKYCRN